MINMVRIIMIDDNVDDTNEGDNGDSDDENVISYTYLIK